MGQRSWGSIALQAPPPLWTSAAYNKERGKTQGTECGVAHPGKSAWLHCHMPGYALPPDDVEAVILLNTGI